MKNKKDIKTLLLANIYKTGVDPEITATIASAVVEIFISRKIQYWTTFICR